MDNVWLVGGKLVAPQGTVGRALKIRHGHIAAIAKRAPRSSTTINLRGAYLSPGFIDLHVWGPPAIVSREAVKWGTTTFLTTFGPESSDALLARLRAFHAARSTLSGAQCLGVHLEGPFLNTARAGALPSKWMRRPSMRELKRLSRLGRAHVKMITLAPELANVSEMIRWCKQHRIVVSLGHSEADAAVSERAIEAGARAVTHVFNGMRPFHHRTPSLLDVALRDPRLTTMAICDGVHVSPSAFRLLIHAKGIGHIALVTDSIEHQGWNVIKRNGAYFTKNGTLAGSCLTMMQAVRNAVKFGEVSISDAVKMATEVPARLLGIDRTHGTLEVGKRADLVAFDSNFRVQLTMIGGRIVYQRGESL